MPPAARRAERRDYPGRLATISVPTSIVVGSNDRDPLAFLGQVVSARPAPR